MSRFQKFLIVFLGLIAVLVAVAAYFFFKITQLQTRLLPVETTMPALSTTTLKVRAEASSSTEAASTSMAPATQPVMVPTTGFTINVQNLPANQQTMARAMGFTSEIIVTPQMVTCATQKIGADRVTALSNGDSPTYMEAIALLGCI